MIAYARIWPISRDLICRDNDFYHRKMLDYVVMPGSIFRSSFAGEAFVSLLNQKGRRTLSGLRPFL